METGNRLTVTRGEGRGQWWKKREGTSQKTCMNDLWTCTMMWGLTVGVGAGLGGGEQRRQNWDNCNRIIIKIN